MGLINGFTRGVLDDLQWLTASECTPDTGSRRDTYIESRFLDSTSWTTRGPATPLREGNLWTGAFTDDADRFALHYGRSLLGRPQRMLLTVESDGGEPCLLRHWRRISSASTRTLARLQPVSRPSPCHSGT